MLVFQIPVQILKDKIIIGNFILLLRNIQITKTTVDIFKQQ